MSEVTATKKPFYKRWYGIIGIIFVSLFIVSLIGGALNKSPLNEQTTKEWSCDFSAIVEVTNIDSLRIVLNATKPYDDKYATDELFYDNIIPITGTKFHIMPHFNTQTRVIWNYFISSPNKNLKKKELIKLWNLNNTSDNYSILSVFAFKSGKATSKINGFKIILDID